MANLIEILGIDADELDWHDLAVCRAMDREDFYDNYETSESTRLVTDQACLSCPALAQCLQAGLQGNEWGVWGGIYLTSGKLDESRNSHKTPEIWAQLKERAYDL